MDAKNQKVENVYDAYGRVTMVKRYPVSTGAEDVNQRTTNTYDYDGSNSSTRNLWGRLAAVTVPNSVTERYSYTSAGLLTSKVSDFGGGIYMLPTVDYSYDNEGKVTQMVYPQYGHLVPPSSYAMYSQRLTLNYSYDSLGQLQGITAGSGSGTNLVTSATYNAAGQLLTLNRPNSVTVDPATELPSGSVGLSAETFQYNGRNQLTRQTFLYSDIEYRFSTTANDGRLTQKKNWVSGEEENYTYDSLGRLATAYTTGPEWGLSWVCDGFGNRLQQNVKKGAAPSTVQTVNVAGFGYDSNGNMTDWSTPSGSVTASYDIDNRMTQIVTPSVTETYKYGPGNLRVRKYQGGTWTYTVYGQGGEVLGTYTMCTAAGTSFLCDARLRVYFGGRLILNGWTGVKPDRLGSPDGTHGRVYPYGEVSGSVTVDQDETFTTYKRDVSTGLDYAQNRYYASSWGRFTSADPYRASGGVEDPQSWNRYTYVENDPVNLLDPSGLVSCRASENWVVVCTTAYGRTYENVMWRSFLGFPGFDLAATAEATWGRFFEQRDFEVEKRAQAKNAIDRLSRNCRDVLGSHWTLAEMTAKVDKTGFLDANQFYIYEKRLEDFGLNRSGTVADYFKQFPLMSGFVSEFNSRPSNTIILGGIFSSLNGRGQNGTLVHEMLHVYTGLDDIGLAKELLNRDFNSGSDASTAVSAFLLDSDCDIRKWRAKYGEQ
ncbi:RHS repeat-associated core domain-containing protein [Paludibaculum fermentans]|uniref:RHS repeat-associated core domain-containing protein n=1 Tax=Paludibaculum fermentans TaxID=1473598 RepID=A0A7S7SNE5_PALFE|nr:RHS repeat-associated core domain-containing protein [Paludibaculum fermentans]QOY91374.1 RHS repeat-associated core domain-containing protein [Paludibaculum fermentans]